MNLKDKNGVAALFLRGLLHELEDNGGESSLYGAVDKGIIHAREAGASCSLPYAKKLRVELARADLVTTLKSGKNWRMRLTEAGHDAWNEVRADETWGWQIDAVVPIEKIRERADLFRQYEAGPVKLTPDTDKAQRQFAWDGYHKGLGSLYLIHRDAKVKRTSHPRKFVVDYSAVRDAGD